MTPHELAGNLTEIVAKHTESEAVWRSAPITHDEMLTVCADLERYLKTLYRDWKKVLEAQDIT